MTGGDTDEATSIYNPATDSWSKASPMNIPRGYNGMTLLSNGQAFTLGGSWSGGYRREIRGSVVARLPAGECYRASPRTRFVTQGPAPSLRTTHTDGSLPPQTATCSRPDRRTEMHWITTSGAGTITSAGPRGSSGTEMEGNAVYYEPPTRC